MGPTIRVVSLGEADIPAVSEMIRQVFDRFVAPGYSHIGNRFFYDYISEESFRERFGKEISLLAFRGKKLAGMLSVKDPFHISLLFVKDQFHRQGIATLLWRKYLDSITADTGGDIYLSVNASPHSIPFYQSLGFEPVDEMCEKNGIRYLPMEMSISRARAFLQTAPAGNPES